MHPSQDAFCGEYSSMRPSASLSTPSQISVVGPPLESVSVPIGAVAVSSLPPSEVEVLSALWTAALLLLSAVSSVVPPQLRTADYGRIGSPRAASGQDRHARPSSHAAEHSQE